MYVYCLLYLLNKHKLNNKYYEKKIIALITIYNNEVYERLTSTYYNI